MPLFRITVTFPRYSNGQRIERGMSVDVVSNSHANPITFNGGQLVQDAFMRIYGIDLKGMNALALSCLRADRIG